MNRKRFACMDCDVDTGKLGEFYFLDMKLWLKVTNSIQGMLCIGCLEDRLGRQLVKSDFTDAYINSLKHGIKSIRLVSRLKALS